VCLGFDTLFGRALCFANAAIRLGYGVAVLLAPSTPAFGRIPLAPDTDSFPEARLFVRGFAAHQIGVGLIGLAGVTNRDLRRTGMLLAAAIDAGDIASALIESRARPQLGSDLTGGIAFSTAGLLSSALALRADR
jgi:hypothetical protein